MVQKIHTFFNRRFGEVGGWEYVYHIRPTPSQLTRFLQSNVHIIYLLAIALRSYRTVMGDAIQNLGPLSFECLHQTADTNLCCWMPSRGTGLFFLTLPSCLSSSVGASVSWKTSLCLPIQNPEPTVFKVSSSTTCKNWPPHWQNTIYC